MIEKLKIKITIIASLIVALYAFINHEDLLRTCYSIIFTIIIFYLVGGFIEIELEKYLSKNKTENIVDSSEEQEDDNVDISDSEFLENELSLDGLEELKAD